MLYIAKGEYWVRIRASVLFCVLILLMAMAIPGSAQNVEYQNTYENTGNQRADIIGVALTQLGYKEGAGNASKYGSWIGEPNSAWCASFVSWCAAQADISEEILRRTVWVSGGSDSFNIKVYYNTREYTPQPGDLFYKNDFSHVGLVLRVEGDSFYTIEGNSDVLGSEEGLYVISNKRKLEDCYFGVPAYKGEGDHDYVKGSEQAHPHRNYYECKTCGDKYYTGSNAYDTGCGSCLTCSCSTSYAGYYICDQSVTVLNVRNGHGSNYNKIGGVHPGEVVYVHAANGSWAHIEYDGIYGYVSMQYLQPYTPPEPTLPPEPTEPESQPTQGPAEDPTEDTHEHVYGEGINKHYHTCVCGETYEVNEEPCIVCGYHASQKDMPSLWWVLCILEGLLIVVLLIYIKTRQKKKRKVKYLHT